MIDKEARQYGPLTQAALNHERNVSASTTLFNLQGQFAFYHRPSMRISEHFGEIACLFDYPIKLVINEHPNQFSWKQYKRYQLAPPHSTQIIELS